MLEIYFLDLSYNIWDFYFLTLDKTLTSFQVYFYICTHLYIDQSLIFYFLVICYPDSGLFYHIRGNLYSLWIFTNII